MTSGEHICYLLSLCCNRTKSNEDEEGEAERVDFRKDYDDDVSVTTAGFVASDIIVTGAATVSTALCG